ncbi:amyloid-like protein 2 [Neolamprologus brichardi]|uniref:amyloid-like protein 2 n=1 Tax=Neolamprologus brichardi TaxID=32507 RepID=UPI0016436E96|nr:amyloid-like protein 2 [Neolamprologus brichardi]
MADKKPFSSVTVAPTAQLADRRKSEELEICKMRLEWQKEKIDELTKERLSKGAISSISLKGTHKFCPGSISSLSSDGSFDESSDSSMSTTSLDKDRKKRKKGKAKKHKKSKIHDQKERTRVQSPKQVVTQYNKRLFKRGGAMSAAFKHLGVDPNMIVATAPIAELFIVAPERGNDELFYEKNPCHLPQAPGPCRGLVSRFFFDSSSQECKQFYYGGCFGNANNFRTMAECQAKCLNPAPESPSPRKDDVQPIIETGEQIANAPLVQGNDTNPETNELCFRPVDKGTCSGSENRYAYIPERKRCQVFSYSGCGGNENNFITRRHCFHKCIRKGHGKRMTIRVRRKNLHNILNYSRRTLDSV